MLKGFSEILKGAGGLYEVNRVVGAFGGVVYILGAHVFVGYEVFWLEKDFDLTAYCLAFPGGLAALGLGTGAAVAIKDRNVAASKIVAETGSKPATPPAPAPKPQPALDEEPQHEEANL